MPPPEALPLDSAKGLRPSRHPFRDGVERTFRLCARADSCPQARNPCFRESPTMSGIHAIQSRPSDATICKEWIKQLGGRSCGSAKLLAGTLRCLHLCWRLPWNWSPAQQLGRCPKPHKGRRPLTLQGALPLDPFLAARLGRASLLLLFLRLFLLIQGFFPVKHLPHLPLRFLHHPVALLNRVLLRVVINLRPE